MCNFNILIKKILCNERNRKASKNSQRSRSLEPQRSKKEISPTSNKAEALREINSPKSRPLPLAPTINQTTAKGLTPEEKADLVAQIIQSLELPATFRIDAQTYEFICEYIDTHGGYEKFQEELERKQRQVEINSMNTLRSDQSNNNYEIVQALEVIKALELDASIPINKDLILFTRQYIRSNGGVDAFREEIMRVNAAKNKSQISEQTVASLFPGSY